MDLQWDEARGRACFIVIVGLESPPCLIGMDIMQPLRVHIDVTNGTTTPAQPDLQTIHLNAAQQQKTTPQQIAASQPQASQQQETATPHATPHAASRALLLQATDIPAETARIVCCHNPWPSEDVYFCPEDALPAFVTGVPALSSGSKLWIAIHNHRPEPLCLHSGQSIGILEVVTIADAPSSTSKPGLVHQPPILEHLSPLQQQQQQLNVLFKEFSDVFMSSAKERTTSAVLRCWSVQLRPTGLRSTSLTPVKTQLFDGRRWRRCSKCWPATSSATPTVPGLRRW